MIEEVAGQIVDNFAIDHLDLWSSAYVKKATTGRGKNGKISPYGIQKLRELILGLAVRGQLVPQDPNDQPSTAIIDKVAVEGSNLNKIVRKKKKKQLPIISEDELAFDVASSWSWVRLGVLVEVLDSLRKPITKSNRVEGPFPYYGASGVVDYVADYIFDEPLVLVGEDGAKWGVGENTAFSISGKTWVNNHAHVLRTISETILDAYLVYYLVATDLSNFITGMTVPKLNQKRLISIPIAVPPFPEQQRIVAKVDELMTLCDQLEQQQTDSLQAHQTLVEALLQTLVKAGDPERTQQAWCRIAEHFDTLFTTEESIDQLKQTILQLAVMGKLVSQDPNDESASKLLKRIYDEKVELTQKKRVKKHQPVEPFGDEFELPDSWETIVVQDFADVRLGSTPSRSKLEYWDGDIPWVSSGEVANGVIENTNEKITQAGFDNSSLSLIPKRSVLIAIIGQGKTRGQSALLNVDACTNQNVAALVFNEKYVVPEFVWLWAQSKYHSHRGEGRGGAQPALNGKKVRSFRFYLPPTAEQHRIVEKVHTLMNLCDALKARIQESQTTQIHLADAVVERAVL